MLKLTFHSLSLYSVKHARSYCLVQEKGLEYVEGADFIVSFDIMSDLQTMRLLKRELVSVEYSKLTWLNILNKKTLCS